MLIVLFFFFLFLSHSFLSFSLLLAILLRFFMKLVAAFPLHVFPLRCFLPFSVSLVVLPCFSTRFPPAWVPSWVLLVTFPGSSWSFLQASLILFPLFKNAQRLPTSRSYNFSGLGYKASAISEQLEPNRKRCLSKQRGTRGARRGWCWRCELRMSHRGSAATQLWLRQPSTSACLHVERSEGC